MTPSATKEILWTRSFVSICIGNFLLFFAFYLLLPILPLYMIEKFSASKSMIGAVLSCYSIAALFIRPVSGFFLDKFSRRPLYLLAYLLFVLTFTAYPFVSLVFAFLLLRILHGLAFGMVSTAGNSLVIDIMPASRRGEGLGYFGIANNLAMATGPMISLFMHDRYQFNSIFYTAIASGVLGAIIVFQIQAQKQTISTNQALSFDRFFLKEGLLSAICLGLTGIPYGMLTSYVSIYGKEIGIQQGLGFFFTFMAGGLMISRVVAGKAIDRGQPLPAIRRGMMICMGAYFLLSAIKLLQGQNGILIPTLFVLVALCLGVGYGMVFPAFNAVFINLAPNNRRATASSTYLTSWDVGVGAGLMMGGYIADYMGGLSVSFFFGAAAMVASLLVFIHKASPHYDRNKLH